MDSVTCPPSTFRISPSTLGKSAATWPTSVVIGVGAGPGPPPGGAWEGLAQGNSSDHAGAALSARRKRTSEATRVMAPMIPTPGGQGKQWTSLKDCGPGGSPPGPPTTL